MRTLPKCPVGIESAKDAVVAMFYALPYASDVVDVAELHTRYCQAQFVLKNSREPLGIEATRGRERYKQGKRINTEWEIEGKWFSRAALARAFNKL